PAQASRGDRVGYLAMAMNAENRRIIRSLAHRRPECARRNFGRRGEDGNRPAWECTVVDLARGRVGTSAPQRWGDATFGEWLPGIGNTWDLHRDIPLPGVSCRRSPRRRSALSAMP